MIENLIKLDRSLFLLINNLPHNLFLDSVFVLLSGVNKWITTIIAVFLIWFEKKNKKTLLALFLAAVFTITIVDFLLKNIIGRLRPEFILSETIVVFDPSRTFAFPSGHAAIAFALAFILGKSHKKWAVFYYLLAFLIAFSRIYLGKHYPSDVLAGAVLGLGIGYLSLLIVKVKNT